MKPLPGIHEAAVVFFALPFLLFSQSTPKKKLGPTVNGTAAYRERVAMQPDAVFEATLEDVSKVDSPADIISTARIENPGNPPYHFSLSYDPSKIVEDHSYSVRVTIKVDGKLIFTSTEAYPVITRGNPQEVNILLHSVGGEAQSAAPQPANLQLPATYVGDLPCADCEGIRYQLNLWPDNVFFFRMSYKGRDRSFDEIGTWSLSADSKILILNGGHEAVEQFAIKDGHALRKLDAEGHEIQSPLNYALTRTASLKRLEPKLKMSGMYSYMADAGNFTECLTGRRFPVAQEGDNAALESAYSKTRLEPGEALLVDLEGQISDRPKVEVQGTQPTLIVDRFIGVRRAETCASRFSNSPLENTNWRLTRLDDEVMIVSPDQPEPSVVLNPDDHRVAGSGGCNRIMGTYQLDGESLRFGQMASTMMACANGMEQEHSFLQAFPFVRTWKIKRHHLELYGEDGKLIARFEARDKK